MEEKTRVKVVPAEAGRVAMARLQRDTDLVTGIIEVCREAGFEMASSQLIIGSLRRAEFLGPVRAIRRREALSGRLPCRLPAHWN